MTGFVIAAANRKFVWDRFFFLLWGEADLKDSRRVDEMLLSMMKAI